MLTAAEILGSRSNDVGRELAREEGQDARGGIGETSRAVKSCVFRRRSAAPDGEHDPLANPKPLICSVREPIGVVAIITPWNFLSPSGPGKSARLSPSATCRVQSR